MKAKNQYDYDLSKITIDKNIVKPHKGGRSNKWFYLFARMKIGDSFAIPYKTEIELVRIKSAMQKNKSNYINKSDKNFILTSRVLHIKKEVRFWRDK